MVKGDRQAGNTSLLLGYNVGNEISVNAQCEEYIASI